MVGELIFLFISLLTSGGTWYLYAMLRASGLHDQRMKGFNALCIVVPFWIVLSAGSTVVKPELFLPVYLLKLLFINIVPYMSFWFFAHFIEMKAADSKPLRAYLITMPAIAVLLLFTSPWHSLYLLDYNNPPDVGVVFLIHMAITIASFLVIYALLFRYIVKNYRKNPLLLVIGVGTILPVVLYVMYIFFPSVIVHDFTAIGYFFTIVFIMYASYGSRLKNVKPGQLGDTLTKITNSQELGGEIGVVEDLARLISREGCVALDTYAVSVWTVADAPHLFKNTTCYDRLKGEYYVRGDISLLGKSHNDDLMTTKRIIIIGDVKDSNMPDGIPEDYYTGLCSVMIAPIRVGTELKGVISVEQNRCTAFPVKRDWTLEEQSFVASLADIMALTITNTELKSLTQELRESDERVQLLLDSAPLSVNLLDKNFECVFVNEEAVRLYGLSSKQDYIDLYATGNLSKEKGIGHIRKAYTEGYCRCEMTFQKPDGEPIPCELTLVRVQYGGDYALAAYARDLREQKAAAEKLRESEKQILTVEEANRRLQTILEMLPVGVVIMSRENGALLYGNMAALQIYRAESFEKDGAGRSIFDFVPEIQHDGRKSTDVIAELFAKNNDVVEIQNRRLGGEVFWARSAYCTINYDGTPATLNVIEDMTAEREYQQRLREIAEKEQEASQLKSRFLATMSHEIRTPMNAIMGMTELALQDEKPDKVKKHIHTIKQAGAHLLTIINDILDFSKIEAGKMEIIEEEYSVASLLNDVISIIKVRAADARLSFAVNADCNIPAALYGDEVKIRQAMQNILSNAVKYTEEGYISLGLYCEITGDDTINIIFEVTDSGIGIRQEDRDKLFTDFTQFDLNRRSIEGVGLGLTITHNIVEAMGGNITVSSEYGKGSTFTVTIPQKFHSHKTLASVEAPKKKHILICERREVYSGSIAYAMKNLGIVHTVVTSGIELEKAMKSSKYDYLFISLELYNENEVTLQKSAGGDTNIVILTEIGETVGETNLSTLILPAYCTNIADILGGIRSDIVLDTSAETFVRFSAPDARVLIVDDIKTNLKVAEGLLKPYNMHVDLCDSGAESIETMEKISQGSAEHYDLIFMDHKMPGMDGMEAVRRIREMGKADRYYAEVPIIALTANAVSGMAEMFIENGFNDFISKPIETARLNTVLEKWIPKDKRERGKT